MAASSARLRRHGCPVTCLAAALWLLTAWPAASQATEPPRAPEALQGWVAAVLAKHPDLLAGQARVREAAALERAASRPLYNPELELEVERAETDVGAIGWSQAIDWAGKREARARTSRLRREAVRAAWEATRQRLAVALLTALARVEGSRALENLARRRAELTAELARIAEERFASGDLPQVERTLARLARAEADLRRAEALDAVAEARQALEGLVGSQEAVPPPPRLPEQIPAPPQLPDRAQLQERLPSLRRLAWEAREAAAEVERRRRDRRPDPTVRVRGGQENDQQLLGLSLSLPLFIRNPFRAEVEAAEQARLAAEARLEAAVRRALARAEAAARRYRLVHHAWRSWRQEASPSLETQTRLLRRLWETGELGTAEYLVQLDQALATEEAARRLETRLWLAWFEWLEASGGADAWLGLETARPATSSAPPHP